MQQPTLQAQKDEGLAASVVARFGWMELAGSYLAMKGCASHLA